jgi:hypothetical protein
VNFLHPVRKLREKVRNGARITRRYDVAQTPYRRLFASGVLPRKTQARLKTRSAAVIPLRLKVELESAQRTRAERAVRPVIAHDLAIRHSDRSGWPRASGRHGGPKPISTARVSGSVDTGRRVQCSGLDLDQMVVLVRGGA